MLEIYNIESKLQQFKAKISNLFKKREGYILLHNWVDLTGKDIHEEEM